MTAGLPLPLPVHLGVHVLGLTVAASLTAYAIARRREAGSVWLGLAFGGLLLAASHVATGALLAGQTAWPLYVRAAGYAAIAVGGAGRLVSQQAPVVVVVAPFGAHVAAAVAGMAAAVSSTRGVLARGAGTVALGVGLLLWGVADLVVRATPAGAATLSILGSVAVAGWLVRRTATSLFARFLGSFLVVLLLLTVALASTSGFLFASDLQREQLQQLRNAAAAQTLQVTDEWPSELLTFADSFAGDTLAGRLRQAAPARESLDSQAASIAELPEIDVVVLVGPEGRALGSWDVLRSGPLQRSDELVLTGEGVVELALRGERASGVASIGEAELFALGAAAVAPTDESGRPRLDRIAGALLLGRRASDPRFMTSVRELSGAETTLLVGDEAAVSTLSDGLAAEVAVAARDPESRVVDVGGTPRFLVTEPVAGDDGEVVGRLALTLDASTVTDVEEDFTRSVFWAALGGLVVAALLAGVAAARTTRPVGHLTRAAERVAGGELDTRVELDRNDEVGRLAGAFNDMTVALQQREEDLRAAARTEAELRQQLEVVTASMGEGLVAIGADGTVSMANPAAAQLLGTNSGRLVGAPLRRVLRGVDVTGEPLERALGGPDAEGTAAARGTIGRGRRATPIAATAAPLEGPEGERAGRVYVLRDVSGEVEVERMKTEFLANVSHELRTPLTPIKGYAEVLRTKPPAANRVREFAGSIAGAASRLERIIGMLVDFAALEAGRIEVNLEATDLSELVGETLGRFRATHPDRRFVRRISRDLPPVQVDRSLLDRVLEELLDNAVKFSDEPVSVLARRTDAGPVRVTVRDRGTGIPRAELDGILRDFHQADGSATRQYGGLGLGLSIVRRIVTRFNADLEIESEVDRGTDVHLYLPTAT